MTVVVDASVAVAALVETGPDGEWAEQVLASGALAAPHLLPAEVAYVIARAASAGEISGDVASLAHADLVDLRVELFAYENLAPRIWELRHNITAYDAWYVALAEMLDAPLATLDARLTNAPGTRCEFLST